MRDPQLGASGLTVFGIILIVLGGAAIAAAPQIMNSAEINTLRYIGGGAAVLGLILAGVGSQKGKQ